MHDVDEIVFDGKGQVGDFDLFVSVDGGTKGTFLDGEADLRVDFTLGASHGVEFKLLLIGCEKKQRATVAVH